MQHITAASRKLYQLDGPDITDFTEAPVRGSLLLNVLRPAQSPRRATGICSLVGCSSSEQQHQNAPDAQCPSRCLVRAARPTRCLAQDMSSRWLTNSLQESLQANGMRLSPPCAISPRPIAQPPALCCINLPHLTAAVLPSLASNSDMRHGHRLLAK